MSPEQLVLSTVEAEYMATTEAPKECIWIRPVGNEMGYPIPTPSCSFEITRAQIHRPEIPNTSSIQSISMVVSVLFHLLRRKAPSWYPRCLLVACLSIFPPKVCLVLSMNCIVNYSVFRLSPPRGGSLTNYFAPHPKITFFWCVIIYSIIFFIMCLGR